MIGDDEVARVDPAAGARGLELENAGFGNLEIERSRSRRREQQQAEPAGARA